MFKFKLNSGSHSEAGKTYKSGEEIDTESDLRRFNSPSGQVRFSLVAETANTAVAEAPNDKPLRELHYKQLVKMAKEEGIDTTELMTKEDVIAALEE